MKIRSKTVISGVVSVVASIAVTTAAVLLLMRGELTRQAHEFQNAKIKVLRQLLEQKGEAKIVNGKLFFGEYQVNDNFEVVDQLTSMVGGTATVFQGDIRVSTNVTKDDGSRAVGTPLVGIAKEIAIDRAQPYRGEADILGVPYFTAYDPILDHSGRTFGVLYVGVRQDEFFRSFRQLLGASIGLAVFMSALFGFLIWLTVGRMLGRLSHLTSVADEVSKGEGLETPLVSGADDEIGELTRSIDRLRNSMRAALERIES